MNVILADNKKILFMIYYLWYNGGKQIKINQLPKKKN